jgi:hypothetical protein
MKYDTFFHLRDKSMNQNIFARLRQTNKIKAHSNTEGDVKRDLIWKIYKKESQG